MVDVIQRNRLELYLRCIASSHTYIQVLKREKMGRPQDRRQTGVVEIGAKAIPGYLHLNRDGASKVQHSA